MALIAKIQVNHKILTIISAQRMSGSDEPDSINHYKIVSMDYREDKDGEQKIRGYIYHRYGDSAEWLMMKALELVVKDNEQSISL